MSGDNCPIPVVIQDQWTLPRDASPRKVDEVIREAHRVLVNRAFDRNLLPTGSLVGVREVEVTDHGVVYEVTILATARWTDAEVLDEPDEAA